MGQLVYLKKNALHPMFVIGRDIYDSRENTAAIAVRARKTWIRFDASVIIGYRSCTEN
jgi:hypothetical protein